MLVTFRLVQAAGAALLTPTSLSLVLATSAPERRQGAVRAWTAVGGAAAALGPVIGGFLVALSWRWVFLVNVPVGLVALVIGWRRLPNVPGHPVPRPDAFGALLVTGGVAALTLGLVQGNDWGWGSTRTVLTLTASAAALAAFVAHTLRHHNPLVEPGLFRNKTFSGASIVSLVFSVAFGAMLLSIVLWCQTVWGWSALRTGLAVAPGPLIEPQFAFLLDGRLIMRFGPGRVIGAGATLFAAGIGWWAIAATVSPNYVDMIGGMLLTGVGVGLTLPTYMAAGAAALPPQAFATGSAVVNMLRQVGLAVGVAVLVAVLGTPHGPGAALSAFRHGWEVIAGASLATALAGVALLRARVAEPAPPVGAAEVAPAAS
jgi:EmrB/QacA subfamily drug resistance transporter